MRYMKRIKKKEILKEQILIRFNKDVLDKIVIKADKLGLTKSSLVRMIVMKNISDY